MTGDTFKSGGCGSWGLIIVMTKMASHMVDFFAVKGIRRFVAHGARNGILGKTGKMFGMVVEIKRYINLFWFPSGFCTKYSNKAQSQKNKIF